MVLTHVVLLTHVLEFTNVVLLTPVIVFTCVMVCVTSTVHGSHGLSAEGTKDKIKHQACLNGCQLEVGAQWTP